MILDSDGLLRKLITDAVGILREPAGKKYRALEEIKSNRVQFTRDFYSGLFLLHVLTNESIIHAEENLGRLGGLSRAEIRQRRPAWIAIRQIFRCINDSIAWICFQPEPSLMIRRTCRDRPRAFLRDQNPQSVKRAMQLLFSKGAALPLWNDATRCLDISDLTVFSPNGIKFVELKEGKVNDEIFEMLGGRDKEASQNAFDEFVKKYGPKGVKQLERVLKQGDEASKLAELTKGDTVFDAFLGKKRIAIDPPAPMRTYDSELRPILRELRSSEFIEHTVDGCFHVLGLNSERVSAQRGRELIESHLKAKPPVVKDVPDCREMIMSLESSFDVPTAMPIMLRGWDPEDIANVASGHYQLFFCFDVNAWAAHLKTARLTWSPKNVGRAELSKHWKERLVVIRERVPELTGPKGGNLRLGTHILQRMTCEAIRPSSLAAYYDYIIDWEPPQDEPLEPAGA